MQHFENHFRHKNLVLAEQKRKVFGEFTDAWTVGEHWQSDV